MSGIGLVLLVGRYDNEIYIYKLDGEVDILKCYQLV